MKIISVFVVLILHSLSNMLNAQIRNDIVVLGSGGGVHFNNILISEKNGTPVKSIDSRERLDYNGLTTGDYDGDGIYEIAVYCKRTYSDNKDRIIIFNQDGSVFSDFNAGERISKLGSINNITSADLNEDGIEEIIVSCSEVGDSSGKFNNLVAFSGSGEVLYLNFDHPSGRDFSGIAGGNFNPETVGDEIIIYVTYNKDYDRLIIFSKNLSKSHLYTDTRQNDYINFKVTNINGGDIDGDGIDELVALGDDKIIIFKNKKFLKEISGFSYNMDSITCRDFNQDGIENIAIYSSMNFSSLRGQDQIIIFKSSLNNDVLSQHQYPNIGNKNVMIGSGTFEQEHPLLFVSKSKVQQLDKSHSFYQNQIKKAKNFKFVKTADEIRPWYTSSGADRNLHFKFAKSLKFAGILYQTGEGEEIIDDCIEAFNQYALKYEKAYNVVKDKYPRQQGVFINNLLHECSWLVEICWAYDLMYERMPREVKINLRNSLLRLAAKRQIGYSPGRNNHTNAHNLAIAAVGFLLADKKFLGMAYDGTDISPDRNQKRMWRGFYEQLQSPDNNDPVLFDYAKVNGKYPTFSDIGIYLPDYTLYEATTSYAYHDIGHLTLTAAMADNNNFHNINDYYYKVDLLARSFISTIFPFKSTQREANVNFPALNDDILQGLKTIPYLEILHSKFHQSSPSPYATILAKNTNTFENFVFSAGNFNNQNDSLITESQNLKYAGWAVLRSGQHNDDPNKIMAVMDYGPYGGNSHGHSDRFNIILYSNYDTEYKQLIGDIGNFRKKGTSKLGYYNKLHNRYVRSTISHNTILINNNRQADPNGETKTKTQSELSLYRGLENNSSEYIFANKICPEMLFDSDNSDSLQYIYANSGYNSSYGPQYSVDRTIAMIADKYIVDIVNVEKKPEAILKYIDWIIRGPTAYIKTDQTDNKAIGWDWERGKYAIPYPNESYNYLYNIDTTKNDLRDNWQSHWIKTSTGSDTLLQIYGINTGDQRLITALSPDSSTKYNFDPGEIKANIITRKYSISGDWSPEFLSVIRPAGAPSIQRVEINDSLIVIKNKEEKIYTLDIKNLILR